MSNWIPVDPESAKISQLENVRGVDVHVIASPHDVPLEIKGDFDDKCGRFVILLRYLDEDKSGLFQEKSDDGIIHVFKGASSQRVERIEVDVKKAEASEVQLSIHAHEPAKLMQRAAQRVAQLRSHQESISSRLNYLAVSEALQQSQELLATL